MGRSKGQSLEAETWEVCLGDPGLTMRKPDNVGTISLVSIYGASNLTSVWVAWVITVALSSCLHDTWFTCLRMEQARGAHGSLRSPRL